MGNKIKYGLKNAHYAVINVTENAVAYGTPVRIPGAVAMSLSPVGETTPFYADDIEYFTAIANNGYDGTLEVALLPDSFRKDVMGEFEDAKMVLFEDSNAVAKNFALLFEFTGDTSGIKHVLYNCMATRPNMESATKGQSIEAKTETLNLTVRPAIDTGLVKAKTTDGVAEADIASWYTTVYLENESTGA